ncbi:MAG: histidine kinase, partial [Variovorax sp.]
ASGSDAVDIPGGTYQVTVTTAGTKTILFKGQVSFTANNDVLLLTVPDTIVPGAIKTLVKIEGTAGANDVPPL